MEFARQGGRQVTLPRLSLRKIACFVATAEAGSVSQAAQRLNLSQAALSEALIDLEHELGVDLFIRHKARGVTLTSASQQLLPEARNLVRHAEDFQALVHCSGSALSGELVVGCFPTILPFVMPKLLQGFQAAHPDVRVRLVECSPGPSTCRCSTTLTSRQRSNFDRCSNARLMFYWDPSIDWPSRPIQSTSTNCSTTR